MSLIVLEFCCPTHGRFESLEERATAPDSKPCPEPESFVRHNDGHGWHPVVCGLDSPWAISAPAYKPQRGAVTQGRVADPNHPMALDTRELAEGMPYNEWKKRRAAAWRDHDRKDPRYAERAARAEWLRNRPDGVSR